MAAEEGREARTTASAAALHEVLVWLENACALAIWSFRAGPGTQEGSTLTQEVLQESILRLHTEQEAAVLDFASLRFELLLHFVRAAPS